MSEQNLSAEIAGVLALKWKNITRKKRKWAVMNFKVEILLYTHLILNFVQLVTSLPKAKNIYF